MDFNIRFENSPSILNTWPLVYKHIFNFLCKEGVISSKPIKAKLCELSNDNSITEGDIVTQWLFFRYDHFKSFSNSRNATLLWALHGCLVPWQRVVSKQPNGQKSITRFTITDSQESFALRVQSYEEADHLRHRRSKNAPIQPFIITIGEDVTKITDSYVYFDGLKTPFQNFIRAVDICYKIYHLFNLQYPKASSTFWNFIQIYFFEINSKKTFSKVNILIDELFKVE